MKLLLLTAMSALFVVNGSYAVSEDSSEVSTYHMHTFCTSYVLLLSSTITHISSLWYSFKLGMLSKQAKNHVTCEEDVYALCAFANCTLNEKTKTANCPCYGIFGESQARIDVAPPDAQVQPASALCNAISDGSLWPGADAISTYSHELEEENGIVFDDNGEKILTWECTTSPNEVRLVPNCMLAPCRVLEEPVTNDYFAGGHNGMHMSIDSSGRCLWHLRRIERSLCWTFMGKHGWINFRCTCHGPSRS
jgi:hypothetical protein